MQTICPGRPSLNEYTSMRPALISKTCQYVFNFKFLFFFFINVIPIDKDKMIYASNAISCLTSDQATLLYEELAKYFCPKGMKLSFSLVSLLVY